MPLSYTYEPLQYTHKLSSVPVHHLLNVPHFFQLIHTLLEV